MDLSQVKLPKWAIVGIAALVLLGIGSAIYNSGWSQGFLMGILTGHTDGAAMTSYVGGRMHGWHGGGFGHGGFGGGFFGFFGAIFRFIFFIFFIGLILKFLGFLRWRRHGWQGGPGWHGGPGSWGGPGWHGGPGGQGERVEGHYGPWWNQPYQQQPQGQPQAQGQPQSQPQGQPQGQPQQPSTPPSGETGTGETGSENKPTPTSWTRV